MTETLTLVSHPGSRGREPFERTAEVQPAEKFEPMFDFIDCDGVRTMWVRDESGGILVGGTLESQLGDVEVDGGRILFDGVLPQHAYTCFGVNFALMWIGGVVHFFVPTGQTDMVVLIQPKRGEFRTISYGPDYGTPHYFYGDDDIVANDRGGLLGIPPLSDEGRALMEHSDAELVFHDARFCDPARYIRRQFEEVGQRLSKHKGDLLDAAEKLRIALDGGPHPRHAHVDSVRIARDLDHHRRFATALTALAGEDES